MAFAKRVRVRGLALSQFSVSLVDRPRADRFHSTPTPKLGGVVVLVSFYVFKIAG